jgi:hypothetical protein
MKKAIVTLSRGYSDNYQYDDLVIRNRFIEENLKNVCDIIIFHEGNILPHQQQFIKSKTSMQINFIAIPPFVPVDGVEFDQESGWEFSWGYRHMCNFWFVDFWKYLDAYDMILRIDDDCIVRSSIDDVFDRLNDKVCVYGEWSTDHEYVTKGLNNFTLSVINTEKPSKNPSGPYTNLVGFNLFRLRQNSELFNYIKKVNESKNIFIYRWGDLPLWGEALYYLFEDQDHAFLPIKYYHGSHINFINY